MKYFDVKYRIFTLNKDSDITIQGCNAMSNKNTYLELNRELNESVRIKRPLFSFRIQFQSSESKFQIKFFDTTKRPAPSITSSPIHP